MERDRLRWRELYDEASLYRAALAIYSKSLFSRAKALSVSLDGETLFDFARSGRRRLAVLHRRLATESFTYRPGAARTYDLNGKLRTFYIYPWAEKVVDLLLYRVLTERLEAALSRSSYAYRSGGFGIDRCQRRIASGLRPLLRRHGRVFLFKRDVSRFFESIDHDLLVATLESLVVPGDFLLRLLLERVRFRYESHGAVVQATRGVPFGTPIACFLANLHLAGLDLRLDALEGVRYFRYADDVLGFGADREVVARAADACDATLAELRLDSKPSHRRDLVLACGAVADERFVSSPAVRHLGLELRADGSTGLSRDKARKLRNLFRYAFRRRAGRLRRIESVAKRAEVAIHAARSVLDEGVRHVAIVDYYLRHVDDESQLRLIDRWLAEEVLAIALRSGHRKGNFRHLPFARLREMGLPSLLHRRRLLLRGEIESSFFRWRESQRSKRRRGGWRQAASAAFSPGLEAAVGESS